MEARISIHITAKPDAAECATAIKLIAIMAGPDVLVKALGLCGMDPGEIKASSRPAAAEDDDEDGEAAAPPPPPSVPPVAGVIEYDAKGVPWDARIHSGKKSKNADGQWKARKNLDDGVKAQVLAELAAAGAIKVPADNAPPPPPPPAAPAGDASIPPPPPAASAPPPPAAPAGAQFKDVMLTFTGLVAQQKLTQPDLIAACVSVGANNAMELKALGESTPGLFEMAISHMKAKAGVA